MYSTNKIFRPWDVSDKNTHIDLEKRESKLRKIRGKYVKKTVDQDCTISTTTVEEDVKLSNPVNSLSDCCERLLQTETSLKNKTNDTAEITNANIQDVTAKKPIATDIRMPLDNFMNPEIYADVYSTFIPDLAIQNEAIFYDSLAQNYAIEMEYARILHEETQAKLINKKQRPKKYKCPHCQVGFSNNGQLKGHVRIHTGERPYRCEEKNCGKTFTRNEELTRHKRIHSGVRPYACGTCNKKFGRRDHLKKHTKTHLVHAERMMPVFLPLPVGYPYVYGF